MCTRLVISYNCASIFMSFTFLHVQLTILASDSSCSSNGALRLVGGQSSHEGVLEYCYNGKWSPFCYLDDEEASVACKQMGYSQYAGQCDIKLQK